MPEQITVRHIRYRIGHRMNGETVLEYSPPQLDPEDTDAQRMIQGTELSINPGYLALQAESHFVEFRRMEIRELTSN